MADCWELEDSSGVWLLEDGSGCWLLEEQVGVVAYRTTGSAKALFPNVVVRLVDEEILLQSLISIKPDAPTIQAIIVKIKIGISIQQSAIIPPEIVITQTSAMAKPLDVVYSLDRQELSKSAKLQMDEMVNLNLQMPMKKQRMLEYLLINQLVTN